MPYLVQTRTDIPNGVLQVLDLWPYTSQRSIYDPPGQTKYVNRGEFTGAGMNAARPTTIAASGHVTTYACYGLAAYLADTVVDGVSGVGITAAVANASAALIATNIIDAGAVVSDASVSAELITGSAGLGTTLLGGGLASVADVLQIVAGGSYLLPAGSAETVVVGSMGNGAFETGTYRTTAGGMALAASFSAGDLASYVAGTFSYGGTAGAALVVYADDGTVYT